MVDRSIALIVLCAGRSSQMGEPKALLRFGNWTALELEVRNAAAAGVGRIVAVIGHRAEEIRAAHSFTGIGIDFTWAMNRAPEGEDLEALKAGLRAIEREAIDAFLFLPVEYPLVARSDFEALIEAHRSHPGPEKVFVPTHEGRAGYPILCRGKMREDFEEPAPVRTAREILESGGIVHVAVSNPGIHEIMDTREDYRRLREVFRQRSGGGSSAMPRGRTP
jgi:molybdenum cofactor cytidylyltransferase